VLLEIAGGSPGPALGAAPTFLKERQLAQRIEMLVKEITMSKPRLFLSLTAIVGLLILAGGVGVWAFPLRAPTQAAAGSQPAKKETPTLAKTSPKLLTRVNPVYPPEAKKAGIQGIVVLRATIEKDGSVSKLKVLSGEPILATAALEAVQKWRYAPGEKAVITDVAINFTLAEDSGPAGGVRGGVYSVGNGVSAPIPIYKPDPPYTKEAKAAKLEGTVTLWIIVGVEGAVADVRVTKPFDKGLTENAVETIKTWKFQPAMKSGKPVPCRVMVEVSFKLF